MRSLVLRSYSSASSRPSCKVKCSFLLPVTFQMMTLTKLQDEINQLGLKYKVYIQQQICKNARENYCKTSEIVPPMFCLIDRSCILYYQFTRIAHGELIVIRLYAAAIQRASSAICLLTFQRSQLQPNPPETGLKREGEMGEIVT